MSIACFFVLSGYWPSVCQLLVKDNPMTSYLKKTKLLLERIYCAGSGSRDRDVCQDAQLNSSVLNDKGTQRKAGYRDFPHPLDSGNTSFIL